MIRKAGFFAIRAAILAALSLASASCSGWWGGVDLTRQRSVDHKLRTVVEKSIPADAPVFEIRLGSSANFSETMDILSVTFFDSVAQEVKCQSVILAGSYAPRDWSVDCGLRGCKVGDGAILADIDMSHIASNIAAASKMMADAGKPFSGIESYVITPGADPRALRHTFTLESKAGAKRGVTRNGRLGTTIEYYTFDFSADSQGDVTYLGE